jgi:citrate lyase subunit beta/citryl-CoA lyase
MRLRSLLFVPGDRPERFAKAAGSGADAIIIDLEDSVLPERKQFAREATGAFLKETRECSVLVRINQVDSRDCDVDLVAIQENQPDGIVLPKVEGAASVYALLGKQYAVDVPILPIATETPQALFQLGSFHEIGARLLGLTWGAEDLSAAVGASAAREADGSYTEPYRMVRNLALFAAHAAGVPAIETVYPDLRDLDGLAGYAARGRRDGFSGMMALHPAQIPVINAAFTPSEEEVARARAIVAAFEDEPSAGALTLDGRMIDRPHLLQARRLLSTMIEEIDHD